METIKSRKISWSLEGNGLQNDRSLKKRVQALSPGKYNEQLPEKDEFKTKSNSENTKMAVTASNREVNTKIKAAAATFSNTVRERYPAGLKTGGLRRLSQSEISPCSNEYKTAMSDLKSPAQEATQSVQTEKTSRRRKVSWNTGKKTSRQAKCGLVSEFEDALRLSRSRPRVSTLPAMSQGRQQSSSDPARFADLEDSIVSKETSFPNGVKLAWQGTEYSAQAAKVKDKRRHISLPCPPRGFCLKDIKPLERKSRSVPQVTADLVENTPRKLSIRRRELAVTGSNEELSRNSISQESHLISSVRDARRSPFVGSQFALGSKSPASEADEVGVTVCVNKSEAEQASVKDSKLHLGSSSEKIAGVVYNSKGQSAHDPPLQFFRQKFAATPVKILKSKARDGHTESTAKRVLRIHYRGNKRLQDYMEEKTLNELFEEMKDCRYLRRSGGPEEGKVVPPSESTGAGAEDVQ